MIYPSAAAALHQQTPGAGQRCISATVRLQRIPGVGEAASWRIPGTDHHARWMPKAIYILKMVLLQHQLPELSWQMKKKVTTMSLRHLSPLNDSTERALALATNYNTKIARTEESYQDLVQVVDDHRKKYSMKTKKDLKKLY